MMRTILGLYAKPATSPEIESTTGEGNNATSVQVEETQELLDGTTVYAGEAAYVGMETKEVPVIAPDDTITKESRDVDSRKYCEWLAVPEADVPFVAVDRQAEFALRALGSMSGGWVDAAEYDLDSLTEHLLDDRQASLTHVIGTDGDASIALHRQTKDADPDVVERALQTRKAQVGFEFAREDGNHYRGTVARSGYCALYAGGGSPESLAGFIQDELIEFAFIPKDGTAVGKGDNSESEPAECEECGQTEMDLHDTGSGMLCTVCWDKYEGEGESSRTTLDDLDSVTVADGGQTSE